MMGEIPPSGSAIYPEQAGLIPRLFRHLFARISELEAGRTSGGRAARPGRSVTFSASCSMLEVS